MKVVVPGVIAYSPFGGIRADGWVFDAQGVAPTPVALVKCMLMHVADAAGIDLGGCDLTRVTPDLERATQDAIAVMRWSENGGV